MLAYLSHYIIMSMVALVMEKSVDEPMSEERFVFMEDRMINFEEELKNFQPSLEVEEAESAIYNHDLTDVTDIISEILRDVKGGR